MHTLNLSLSQSLQSILSHPLNEFVKASGMDTKGTPSSMVHKILTLVVVGFLFSHQAMSQKWLPEFRVRIDYIPRTLINEPLGSFLAYGHTFTWECTPRISIFHFRVNYQGRVDSVYSIGNFSEDEKKLITQNILNTSGNWILPLGTKPSDFCWFLYPCFIFPYRPRGCQDNQGHLYQARLLHELLSERGNKFDRYGRYSLHPSSSYYDSIR